MFLAIDLQQMRMDVDSFAQIFGFDLKYKHKMYKLSRVIQAHKRDVRCLDYHAGFLVTGGNDKTFSLYSYVQGNSTLITTSDIFESEVVAIRINRYDKNSSFFVVMGCRNGKIFAFDREGNPSLELVHNSAISSIDFINANTIVTGSWDGKAIVWNLSTQKMVSENAQHKHAVTVFYNRTSDNVVSGSQDKALNLWDWRNGAKIKRVDVAHDDIVREIADIEGSGMIITCSNDEKLKLWSADLQPIETLYGHTAFVFAVKALKLGRYVSGGEDRVLKFWGESATIQDIPLPCSVWSIAFDENEDVFVAGSDGFVRTFTTDQGRRADQDVEEMLNKQVAEASSKRSGMSEEEIKKLLTTHQMKAIKGKKEGEIKVFRNGMSPQAFIWQNNTWVKMGDVITEAGPAGAAGGGGQPRYYPGDKYFQAGNYDYIFDVDDESGVPKVIPFNDGANPMEAAEKYCKRQGLTKGYIEQIRKFLIQNSSRVPRASVQASKEKEVSTGQLKCTPSTSIIEYNDIKNPAALFNKLKQFNEKAQAKKLTQKQLAYVERIAIQLENSATYHTWKLDFKEMDALKKLLTWPKALRFPVWDLLRAFLKHYQSESLFSGLEAGGDIITQLSIGLQTEYSEAIYTLIFKTFSNALIQNTNKGGMIKNVDVIFQSLNEINKRRDLSSPNYMAAYAAFLYNFSIAFIQKNLEKEEILNVFAEVLRRRLELEENEENRSLLLQAGANILFKYHKQVGSQYGFLIKFLQNDDVSSDIKVFY